MKDNNKASLVRDVRSFTFTLLLLLLGLFVLFILIDRIMTIHTTKERIYDNNMKQQSELIRDEILNISHVVYYLIDNNYDKNKLMDYLRNVRFGNNDNRYIFVVSYDGTALINGTQRELEGKNIWEMEDPNGVKVIQEERKAAEKPGGDFIFYSWRKPTTGEISPKVSYIIGIPELKWMIGTGVYLNTVEDITAIEVKQINRSLIYQLLGLIFLFVFAFVLTYIRFKRLLEIVSSDISVINDYFITAGKNRNPIDISKIRYKKFSNISEYANKMMARRYKEEKEKDALQIRLMLQKEQSPLAYVDWDLDSRIIGWNKAAEDLFGYTKEEVIGHKTSMDLIIPDWEQSEIEVLFNNLKKRSGNVIHRNYNITKDGRIITCEWYNYNLTNADGNILGITAIGIDITEKLHIQEEMEIKNVQLEKGIKEKNILLKEVHHRVKNNMAIIASMLSLQSNTIEDRRLRDLLQSSQNRIQAMAMVHENIYKNKSLSEINIKSYITELIESLMQSFDLFYDNMVMDIDVPDISLEMDMLIPLGMIINEIVSNSFKHAYKEGTEFKFSVIIKNIHDNKMYLSISDNGPGFNEDDAEKKEGSIGLMLIRGLVDQIRGRLKITTKGKTEYEIYF